MSRNKHFRHVGLYRITYITQGLTWGNCLDLWAKNGEELGVYKQLLKEDAQVLEVHIVNTVTHQWHYLKRDEL